MSRRFWVSKRTGNGTRVGIGASSGRGGSNDARVYASQDIGNGVRIGASMPAGRLLTLWATGALVIGIAVVVMHYGFGWFPDACKPGDTACLAAENARYQASIRERVETLYRTLHDPGADAAERENAAYSLARFKADGHVPMAERAAYAHEKREEAERQEQKLFEQESRHLARIRNAMMQRGWYPSEADRRFLDQSEELDRQDPGRIQRREKLEPAQQRDATGIARESARLYQQRQAEDAQRRQRLLAVQERQQEILSREQKPALPQEQREQAPAPAAIQAPAQGADRSMYMGG
ncbi:hypothetical protein AB4Z48_18910 [Cupriavidus sp. 2TAF22]|uniref:hypothetical protein n=1 Tax=unclassified Cupriavidus TaxID=2640874 RepID=UPI003F934FA6